MMPVGNLAKMVVSNTMRSPRHFVLSAFGIVIGISTFVVFLASTEQVSKVLEKIFPLEQVHIRSKTGSAEVYGKQSTSWVASYDENYVVVMMVSQGGTGSGTSGPAVRKIWETLYGIDGEKVESAKAAIPGTVPPSGLPNFMRDGSILPPARRE